MAIFMKMFPAGGGFKYFFIFTPNLGEDDFQFDEHIFQDGLVVQPPTSSYREIMISYYKDPLLNNQVYLNQQISKKSPRNVNRGLNLQKNAP